MCAGTWDMVVAADAAMKEKEKEEEIQRAMMEKNQDYTRLETMRHCCVQFVLHCLLHF